MMGTMTTSLTWGTKENHNRNTRSRIRITTSGHVFIYLKKGVCMVHCSVCKTDFSCLQTCWQKWLSKTHWVENAPTIIENWEIKRLWLRLLQNCQLKWSNKDQSPGLRLWCAKLLLSLTAAGVLNKSVKLCLSIEILLYICRLKIVYGFILYKWNLPQHH